MKKYKKHYKKYFKGANKNQIKRMLYIYYLISGEVKKVYSHITGKSIISFKLSSKKIIKKANEYQDYLMKDSILEFIASHNIPEDTINKLVEFYNISEKELVNACKID